MNKKIWEQKPVYMADEEKELLMKLSGVRKRISDRFTLKQVNLEIPAGRIIGVVGENGAGKSTLLRLMAGILHEDEGEIVRFSDRITYVPPREAFQDWMKVKDLLTFYRGYYRNFDQRKAEILLEQANISRELRVGTLSRGQQERVALILSVSVESKLYLMDEPFSGADPAFKKEIRQFLLQNLPEQASTVIATHLLRDLEQLFDEIIFFTGNLEVQCLDTEFIRADYGMSVEQYYLEVIRYGK